MLLTLTEWARIYYKDPPPIGTLRRWARNGNIFPQPEKQGREYKVHDDAFYIKPNKAGTSIRQYHPNGRVGKKSALLEKLIDESKKIRC
ncbi:excisionase [Entomohabitans teleogrylli]|uniref:excisionase n=1 Tax=Entomohabitans teleogrylli TaxID=1384589 RepID=UPI0008FC6EB8|nr:excisionase [Entomohabitans teleogrylli]